MRFAAVVAVGIGLVLSSCGGGGSAKPDADVITPTEDAAMMDIDAPPGVPDLNVSVSPTSVTGPIGTSHTVGVTISRQNLPGAVTLSARDLPTGVTVTFDPTTLTNVNSSVATITFNAGTAAGSGSFTVVANAGTLENTATVSFVAQTITVTGTVSTGQNTKVVLVGKGEVTAGVGGSFTYTDVTPPYDLYTYGEGFGFPGPKIIHYYQGLMRSDPYVVAASGLTIATFVSQASIQGTIGNNPGYPNEFVGWGDTSGYVNAIDGSNHYGPFNAQWPSAATKTGTLHALVWNTKASGSPDLIRYGATNVTLTQNGANNALNVSLANAATATISGTLTPPASFPFADVKVRQMLGSNSVQLYSSSGVETLDVTIPVIAAGKSTLFAITSTGGATSTMDLPELNANTDASFTMAAPATLTSPAAAAIGVTTSTDFTWTGSANTVSQVVMSTSGTIYNIYTHGNTARIPATSLAPLPAGATFSWSVAGYAPYTHVDEVARQGYPVYPSDFRATGTRATYTSTASRSFTSQ